MAKNQDKNEKSEKGEQTEVPFELAFPPSIDEYAPALPNVEGDKPETEGKTLTKDQKEFVLTVQKNDYVLNTDFIEMYNQITGEKEVFQGYHVAQINRMKRILRETVDKNYKQN